MTQATLPRTIPPPQADDCEDVVSALETADLFWNRGDSEEALRWLRRAIETAGDIGADTRAAALARVAADLKSATSPSTAPAPVRDGLSTRPPPHSAMRARTEPVSLGELEPDPRRTLVGFTLPVRNGAEPSHAPPPDAEIDPEGAEPSHVATTEAIPAGDVALREDDVTLREGDVREDDVREGDVAVGEGDVREGDVALREDAVMPREGDVMRHAGEVFATKPSDAAQAVDVPRRPAAGGRPFPRSALHVYVMPNAGDGERLDVRVLRAGELPPPGAERAMLVPLEREVDLVAPGRSKSSTSVH